MEVNAASWSRFKPHGLMVARDLLGFVHRFEFEERRVEVRLPQEQHATSEAEHDTVVRCFMWKKIAGEEVPFGFDISAVDVVVDIDHAVSIQKEMIGHVDLGIPTKSQADILDKLTSECDTVARKAFDYWIRVVRWTVRSLIVGRPIVVGYESGWSTYLIEKSSRQRFWAAAHTLKGYWPEPLSVEQWNTIQERLNESRRPPIWFEFLFDAYHKADMGDQSGCILSLAIALENMLRHVLLKQIPHNELLDPRLIETISEINVRAVIKNITKCQFWTDEWKQNCKLADINKILDLRNKVAHLGHFELVGKADLDRFLKTARVFLEFADAAV